MAFFKQTILIQSDGTMRYIRQVLKWIFDPTIFVTTFAPWAIQNALLIFRDQVTRIPNDQMKAFQDMLLTPTVYTLIDFSVQLYTAFLGWIFLCFKLGSSYAHILFVSSEKNSDSNWKDTLGALIFILVLISGLLIFVFGIYWNIDILQLYDKGIGTRVEPPPLKSPITWLRGIILIIGVFAFILPNNKTGQNKSSKSHD